MPQSTLLGIYSKATKLSYGANFVICVCMCNYILFMHKKNKIM